MLEQAGYVEIGMDHFALKSDSLWQAAVAGTLHRNFMGYTSRFVALDRSGRKFHQRLLGSICAKRKRN
jgi:coproporphyrinogen III oxidase-like Fe-S oxidoreductase